LIVSSFPQDLGRDPSRVQQGSRVWDCPGFRRSDPCKIVAARSGPPVVVTGERPHLPRRDGDCAGRIRALPPGEDHRLRHLLRYSHRGDFAVGVCREGGLARRGFVGRTITFSGVNRRVSVKSPVIREPALQLEHPARDRRGPRRRRRRCARGRASRSSPCPGFCRACSWRACSRWGCS